MTSHPSDSRERIGPLLARLRQARGLSQLRLAEKLCEASGMPTVSRHEVSRWERDQRIPGSFWLTWLAVVLEKPLEQLETTATASRGSSGAEQPDRGHPGRQGMGQLWRAPTTAELLATLDHSSTRDVPGLAHAWLAGPPDHPSDALSVIGWEPDAGDATSSDLLDLAEARLGRLRRADDMIGGLDLAGRVDRRLRDSIRTLRRIGHGGLRPRALRVVAGHAQLAGWVHTDAGDYPAARRAYQVGLHAAAHSEDRLLAAHVLGSLSHQSLAAGNPDEALLLARSGLAGVTGEADDGGALVRALLLHRVALAAAHAGQRPEAEVALSRAQQILGHHLPENTPQWLYWLDETELSAMTGRCLAVLGRPLRAVPLLAERPTDAGPRTAALYDGWLVRAYLALGEVEHACSIAGRVLSRAVSTGSARLAEAIRHLHPLLLRHRDVTAVRDYQQHVEQATNRLPPDWTAQPRSRPGTAGGARRLGKSDRPGTQSRAAPAAKNPSDGHPVDRRVTAGSTTLSGTSDRPTESRTPTPPAPPPSQDSAPHARCRAERTPAPAAAAFTASRSANIPMGIRYKSGPAMQDAKQPGQPRGASTPDYQPRQPGRQP